MDTDTTAPALPGGGSVASGPRVSSAWLDAEDDPAAPPLARARAARRSAPGRRRAPGTGSRRQQRQGGRHARQADPLAITVKPLGPGSHRAPGTLPLESWVLAGRPKQQALLAGLVAVGLALVMIPTSGPDTPPSPVTAAGQSAVQEEQARQAAERNQAPDAAGGNPVKQKEQQQPQQEQPKEPAAPKKPPAVGTAPAPVTPAAPPSSAAPTTEPPLIQVPPGDGPFRSLRTTGSKTVALTFDDGPDPVQTPAILTMLAAYEVKATFCLVGEQVAKHPDIVRQIVAAGHTLCNHTWNHDFKIGKKKPEEIRADLQRTHAAILAAVPDAEVPFFRAPGGNFTDRLVQVAYQEQMRSLYWEVDPRDWEHKADADEAARVAKVVSEVQKSVKPGAIVLSHDFNQPTTILAYAQLLPWLAANFELGIPPAGAVAPTSGL